MLKLFVGNEIEYIIIIVIFLFYLKEEQKVTLLTCIFAMWYKQRGSGLVECNGVFFFCLFVCTDLMLIASSAHILMEV